VTSRSLYDVLAAARRNRRRPALMVDVKCRSPRDGELISDARLEPYVQALLDGGVDALSTPTDPQFFGGNIEIAQRIRRLADVPLMRKEFFRTVEQMDESYQAGFDAVQLSLSTITDPALFAAMRARAEHFGLEVIIGVHNAAQLARAVELGAVAVGLNNRDITALELDDGTVDRSAAVLSAAPADVFVISESAFATPADVAQAAEAGADAVLVGTAMARSHDPAALLRALRSGVGV
jgi:indole-3-glycerol phosphate synthase